MTLLLLVTTVIAHRFQPGRIDTDMQDENRRLNDISHRNERDFGHLRDLDPTMPDLVWATLMRYEPRLPAPQWQAVQGFVLETIVRMRPRTHGNARRLTTFTGRYCCWRWATGLETLTMQKVFTNAAIHLYAHQVLTHHSDTYRWGMVRQLGLIAETLTETTVTRLPRPFTPSTWRPFTTSETAVLHSWARSLNTSLARRNAHALLGLAGGAGLTAEEIATTRLRHLHTVDGRLAVDVPGPKARRTWVRHPWTKTLARALDSLTDPNTYLFHAHHNPHEPSRGIQSFLTDHPGRLRPTPSRLRSTWLVDLINNGLPLPVILELSGLASANALAHYAHFVSPMDTTPYLGLAVGEELPR